MKYCVAVGMLVLGCLNGLVVAADDARFIQIRIVLGEYSPADQHPDRTPAGDEKSDVMLPTDAAAILAALSKPTEHGTLAEFPSGSERVQFQRWDDNVSSAKLANQLSTSGHFRTLVNTQITTASGKLASLHALGETTSAEATPRRAPKRVGTQIDCVPTLLEDDRVRLELRASFSELVARDDAKAGDARPQRQERAIDTAFVVDLGQSVMLSGLNRRHSTLPSSPEQQRDTVADKSASTLRHVETVLWIEVDHLPRPTNIASQKRSEVSR